MSELFETRTRVKIWVILTFLKVVTLPEGLKLPLLHSGLIDSDSPVCQQFLFYTYSRLFPVVSECFFNFTETGIFRNHH